MIIAGSANVLAYLVIVAEDDALIRMMAVDALANAGFVVIEAAHADDALTILTTRADQVHALFTDIHMPGTITGLELAHHVCGQWPWIALLVASGKARPTPAEMPPGSRFLSKPYDPDHMVQHVRQLLNAG
jgi:CheY-like chemotaxis protein